MTQSPAELAAANRRGILFMMIAVGFFICGDACMKILARDMPVGETLALRSVLGMLLVAMLLSARGDLGSLKFLFDRRVTARSVVESCVVAMFFTALSRIGLGEATVINQTAPLIVTALAALLFKEQVGWRRWTATLVGFAGVALVAKPNLQGVDWPILLVQGAAFLVAVRDLLTRRIPANISSEIAAFSTAFFAGLMGVVLSIVIGDSWIAPTAVHGALILAAAFFSNMGNFFLIRAFRGGEISVVSPFRYVVVIFALTLGFVLFGEVPDLASIAGLILIVGSGLYTLHRQRVRARMTAGAA